jgi:hypothetical protein
VIPCGDHAAWNGEAGQAGRVPVLHEPLPSRTARLLRRAVLDLASSEHRHRFPAVLHAGVPGGAVVSVTDDPSWDQGLRTDIVGSLLTTLPDPEPWAWLTRVGPDSLQDVDAAWLAPVLAAFAEQDADATFVVVTRHGWTDPRSGLGRTWKRIRGR